MAIIMEPEPLIGVRGKVYDVDYDGWRLWFWLYDNTGDKWANSMPIEDWMQNWLLTEGAKFTVWMSRGEAYTYPLKSSRLHFTMCQREWRIP